MNFQECPNNKNSPLNALNTRKSKNFSAFRVFSGHAILILEILVIIYSVQTKSPDSTCQSNPKKPAAIVPFFPSLNFLALKTAKSG